MRPSGRRTQSPIFIDVAMAPLYLPSYCNGQGTVYCARVYVISIILRSFPLASVPYISKIS